MFRYLGLADNPDIIDFIIVVTLSSPISLAVMSV